MAIYVRNWNSKWVRSVGNYPFVLRFHLILAQCREWQLLITPKHVILGAYYGYTSSAILKFVRQHLKDILNTY
jgi:hypothetical protein